MPSQSLSISADTYTPQDSVSIQHKPNDTYIANILAGSIASTASLAHDAVTAENIFDAARQAKDGFSNMSNDEIVDYCSSLNEVQMQGMVSLVKGRYFEEEVAAATGGVLFEARNHPDTDITIDGEAIQLKSGGYGEASIADGVTIHTPEDYGWDSGEIGADTASTLGGDTYDFVEAGLSGLGGIGVFSAVRNTAKTIGKFKEANFITDDNKRGLAKENAVIDGVSDTIEDTLKTIETVGKAGYKVITSKPAKALGRGIGRSLLWGLQKLDDKLK